MEEAHPISGKRYTEALHIEAVMQITGRGYKKRPRRGCCPARGRNLRPLDPEKHRVQRRHHDQRQHRGETETGHDGDRHIHEEHVGQQRNQPQDGGRGREHHRPHAADGGVQYRVIPVLARLDLLVDLLDQHDGILDQQAHQ